ncbi:response regulator [Shewanella mangrovi]|uniref:response regulator n=1 Tax=Shewanella mangrovi TaxID=1515746 RepID=UPI0007B03DEC|nr:response regulator [Shewanella mangrovi]
MPYHVLVVEDEYRIAALLIDYFQAANMLITHVAHGDLAVGSFQQANYDLLLLDVNLPGQDGYSICAEIRSVSSVPIMILSALSDEEARLKGLGCGADDYVCKPFSPREVVAKSQALLRRSHGEWPQRHLPQQLTIDHARYRIVWQQTQVELTKIEFAMLHTLVKNPGRIYSRNQLMSSSYGDFRVVSERTIDSHIKKLRKKLNTMLPDQENIESIYGVGYRYIGPAVIYLPADSSSLSRFST